MINKILFKEILFLSIERNKPRRFFHIKTSNDAPSVFVNASNLVSEEIIPLVDIGIGRSRLRSDQNIIVHIGIRRRLRQFERHDAGVSVLARDNPNNSSWLIIIYPSDVAGRLRSGSEDRGVRGDQVKSEVFRKVRVELVFVAKLAFVQAFARMFVRRQDVFP